MKKTISLFAFLFCATVQAASPHMVIWSGLLQSDLDVNGNSVTNANKITATNSVTIQTNTAAYFVGDGHLLTNISGGGGSGIATNVIGLTNKVTVTAVNEDGTTIMGEIAARHIRESGDVTGWVFSGLDDDEGLGFTNEIVHMTGYGNLGVAQFIYAGASRFNSGANLPVNDNSLSDALRINVDNDDYVGSATLYVRAGPGRITSVTPTNMFQIDDGNTNTVLSVDSNGVLNENTLNCLTNIANLDFATNTIALNTVYTNSTRRVAANVNVSLSSTVTALSEVLFIVKQGNGINTTNICSGSIGATMTQPQTIPTVFLNPGAIYTVTNISAAGASASITGSSLIGF